MKTISKILLGFCLLGMAVFAQAQNVVVVSSKSAVASLTKEQIADIYLGNSKEFPGGGQALPLLPASGGARSEFFDKVLEIGRASCRERV